MRTWDEPPKKDEVENELKRFFSLLRAGDLDAARAAVAHASEDWDSQIWSIWQDSYLPYLEERDEAVDDDSFEGKAWLADLTWLEALWIDEAVQWDGVGERVDPAGEHLFVNLTYQGAVLDVSGDFRVVAEDGCYRLTREIIHVA